jgi:hypothetical protein
VLADVSYTGPTEQGFAVPQYWRFTVHGERGVMETSLTTQGVTMWRSGEASPVALPLDPPRAGGYLDDFLTEALPVPERPGQEVPELTTAQVLDCSRATLIIQEAADRGKAHVGIPSSW